MSIFIERGQIMTKGKKLGTLAVIFTVFALLLTVAFSVNDKKEAKAYFKRISLKKCAISLSANYYDWSGKEIRPAVTVKYNGADLVIGTHPHVIQGIEKYNDKYIVYSLGNFVFGGNQNPPDKDTFMFRQTFTFYKEDLRLDDNIEIIPASVSGYKNKKN